MRKNLAFALLLAVLSATGCSSMSGDNCPYLIADQVVELGSSEGEFNFAGTRFTFYNASDKDVESFTVSFMLYDSDGNNPFIGSNNVVSTVDGKILSGKSSKIVLSLDDSISVVPEEPYKIDFMYVRKIVYADGSEWTDPFGMYASREVTE